MSDGILNHETIKIKMTNETVVNGSLNSDQMFGSLDFAKGDTGLSAFEEWKTLEGNEDKTFDDFMRELGGTVIEVETEYIRTEPTQVEVGGVKIGTTFNGTVQDALDKLLYPPIDVNMTFNIENNDIKELGIVSKIVILTTEIIKGNAVLSKVNWYKGDELINSQNITESGTYQCRYTQDISSNTTFTCELIYTLDGVNKSIKKNSSIKFMNKVYWGTRSIGNYDSAFVLSLQQKELSETKARTITVNPTTDDYIYYAIPSSYGEPIFTVGGFEGGFLKETSIPFTNASGYTTSYDIWRSNNKNLGNTTITIK